MGMRAQVSLQFYDENLYNGLIQPKKEDRTLNSIIVRCLSAYYYNEDVRNAIEGVEQSDEQGQSSAVLQHINDAIGEVRGYLSYQDFVLDSLSQTFDSASENIKDNILNKANQEMESRGYTDYSEGDYGAGTPKLTDKFVEDSIERIKSGETVKTTSPTAQYDDIMQLLTVLCKKSGDPEVLGMLDKVSKSESASRTNSGNSESKTSSVFHSDQVPMTIVQEESVSSTPVSNIQVQAEIEVQPEPEVEDATDAMADFLASL